MNIAAASAVGLMSAAARALRYRFFLVAGVFPYLLGAAVAYHSTGTIQWWLLFVGFLGVLFVSIGIEGLNEHFDSEIGGERVFEFAGRAKTWWHLPVGLAGFALAFMTALYLAHARGWPVLGFALFGGAAALAYLMPPVQLSYRGFGEAAIAVSYGPGLTLGSFYLQTGGLSWRCLLASLLPALLILALALANEIPDYYGDRLVGKRNIIVRIGRENGAYLYGITLALCLGVLVAGVLAGVFPVLVSLGLLLVPLALSNGRLALRDHEVPARFMRVIRGTMLLYVLLNIIAILSYAAG